MTPEEIARAYLAAVGSGDAPALRRLFAEEGELVTAGGTLRGPDEIVAFYERAFAAAPLDPRATRLVADGGTVAVEIDLHAGGVVLPVADFFTIEGERITRLAVYTGPPARR